MSEETIQTSAEIIIGGQTKTINKLKAGKFYDAQKIIAEMFRETSQLSTSSKSVDGGTTPDIKDVDLEALVSLFEKFPNHVAKFIATCADMPEEDLLKDAYPEEINTAFSICLKLNNVMENLKNSVAPIKELGLQSQKV